MSAIAQGMLSDILNPRENRIKTKLSAFDERRWLRVSFATLRDNRERLASESARLYCFVTPLGKLGSTR